MRARRAIVLLAFAALASSCDRPGSSTRVLHVQGVPVCARGVAYARPIVLRLDRDRSLFESEYTLTHGIAPSPAGVAEIDVARMRMKATLRLGVCNETSLSTWDCNAASWVAETTLTLDDRTEPAEVTMPPADVPCADGSRAK